MPLAALREILAAAGMEAGGLPDITGTDPVVRTRYRVGAAGAAAPAGVSRSARRGGFAQKRALSESWRAAAAAAMGSAERVLPRARRLDRRPLQFPQSPRSGAEGAADGA